MGEAWVMCLPAMALLFSVLEFAVAMDAFFFPFVKRVDHISTSIAYLAITAACSSHVIFSISAGSMIRRIGYKWGRIVSFWVPADSFYLIVPAMAA